MALTVNASLTVQVAQGGHTVVHGTGNSVNVNGNAVGWVAHGWHNVASSLTALRFLYSAGNISSGNIRLVGIK